jgi:RNA polymerase sigma factor (sigma-70 family)
MLAMIMGLVGLMKATTMIDETFIGLVEKHRAEFYRFVQRTLWNPNEADDVFSEAVLVAYRSLDRFQEGTNFRAWVFKILVNKCFVANRETRRTSIDIDSIDEYRFKVEDEAHGEVLKDPEWFVEQVGDELSQALGLLSTAERSCFLLLTLEKYAYKEIAEILEMPVGTVMTHLSRGRTKLRKRLVAYAQETGVLSAGQDSNRKTSDMRRNQA